MVYIREKERDYIQSLDRRWGEHGQ
jgi:hypothetical protein